MTDDHKPPVTSTPVGLIGVSDKDASGYDHKADPLDLDALAEVAEEIRSLYTRPTTGEWPDGLVEEELAVKRLYEGYLALLAALKEAQADNARLTQLAEGRSKLGLLAVYMSDVMDDADMVAARDAYLADVWDAGWHEHYLEMDRTNPYRRSEAP